jgi:hypothetical protein
MKCATPDLDTMGEKLESEQKKEGTKPSQGESVKASKHRRRIAKVDFYLPLERPVSIKENGSRLKVRNKLASALVEIKRRGGEGSEQKRKREPQGRWSQLSYWLLFIGMIIILLFVGFQSLRP